MVQRHAAKLFLRVTHGIKVCLKSLAIENNIHNPYSRTLEFQNEPLFHFPQKYLVFYSNIQA